MPFLVAYEGALLLDDDVEKARLRAMSLVNNKSHTPLVIYQITPVRKLIPPEREVPPPPLRRA